MKEEIISFETAKLANEKGFIGIKSQANNWYCNDGTLYHEKKIDGYKGLKGWNCWEWTEGFRFDAPTQSLLQKWLREKHDIDVYIIPNGMRDKNINDRLYHPCIWFKDEYQTELHSKYSYEEALEKGLQEALKIINND